MHFQRFEVKSLKRDEYQPGYGSTKCERASCMPALQNGRVSGT